MIDKNQIRQKFIAFHIKFVHSPLIVKLTSGSITAICLPIDVNSIIRQLREENRPEIKIRVMEAKLSVMCIPQADGYTLLNKIAQRFEASKSNLMDSVKKMEHLNTANQLGKLNEDFHGYYRTFIKASARDSLENATAAIGRCQTFVDVSPTNH